MDYGNAVGEVVILPDLHGASNGYDAYLSGLTTSTEQCARRNGRRNAAKQQAVFANHMKMLQSYRALN
jgi:hypothetical protein